MKSLLESLHGEDYEWAVVRAGAKDPLAVVYDKNRLRCVSAKRLPRLGSAPEPIACEFVGVKASDVRFLWVVVDLLGQDSVQKEAQALWLNDWVAKQEVPVVLVGRFDLSWISDEDHHEAYDALVRGGRLSLVWRRVDARHGEWFYVRLFVSPGLPVVTRMWERLLRAYLWSPERPIGTPGEELAELQKLVEELPDRHRATVSPAVERVRRALKESR